jgi:hypothetical protein
MNATPDYDAYFVGSEVERDRAPALGLKWFLEQPGEPLVLLHAKKMVTNNRLLAAAVSKYHLRVERRRRCGAAGTAGRVARSSRAGVLKCIDDALSVEASAVCVVGWRENDPNHQAWIAARNAVDLDSGDELGRDPKEIISDPVVRIAIDYASTFVNHNNALVQYDDKAYFIRTLEELVAGGHPFHLDEVVTYAMRPAGRARRSSAYVSTARQSSPAAASATSPPWGRSAATFGGGKTRPPPRHESPESDVTTAASRSAATTSSRGSSRR